LRGFQAIIKEGPPPKRSAQWGDNGDPSKEGSVSSGAKVAIFKRELTERADLNSSETQCSGDSKESEGVLGRACGLGMKYAGPVAGGVIVSEKWRPWGMVLGRDTNGNRG